MGDAIAHGGIYDTEPPSGDRLRRPVVSHAPGGGWPAAPGGHTQGQATREQNETVVEKPRLGVVPRGLTRL